MTSIQSYTKHCISIVLNYFKNCVVSDGSFDSLGGVLQPTSLTGSSQPNSIPASIASNNNNNHHQNTEQPSSALLTGDLESSLASLAENLSINSRPAPIKKVFFYFVASNYLYIHIL